MDFCKWFCVEYIEQNKWLYQSRCGLNRVISKNEKFFKYIHMDNNINFCPNCKKPITVGELLR